MKVIKRNGKEVSFDRSKIYNAIIKAMYECRVDDTTVANKIADEIASLKTSGLSVEDIQDLVEQKLMSSKYKQVARAYIRYRYDREKARQKNTTDDSILTLIDADNELIKQENSNKNPMILSTQRDYIAGEVSKDITNRLLLPPDIAKAHQEGIIHFHDSDYFIQHSHNCDVWNLEDMLQNGTMISNTLIEKPHSFSTACNITTQIMAQVASCQYGGQTITLTHLAPFVNISRNKIREDVKNEIEITGGDPTWIETITERRLLEEIKRGVQMIQYQILTLQTTNGQTPFASIFMYLGEAEDPQLKHDLALIIEEVLRQRIEGVKNENGAWIAPAFPKLLYVLEEDNITEDSPYWYLTQLAAECTAKRMVPDYISAKIMKELKGDIYPCMGKRILSPYKTSLTIARGCDAA